MQKLRKELIVVVAPFAGAWIEICLRYIITLNCSVAPFAGAWIEMFVPLLMSSAIPSLPSRERGLKCILDTLHNS